MFPEQSSVTCSISSSELAMASIISTTPGAPRQLFPTSRGPYMEKMMDCIDFKLNSPGNSLRCALTRRRAVIADVARTLLSISGSRSFPLQEKWQTSSPIKRSSCQHYISTLVPLPNFLPQLRCHIFTQYT